MLFVCLSAEGVENALRQLGDEPCAELRIDLVKPTLDEMKAMISGHPDVWFIVTCRPGVFDEETSLQYLETAAKCGAKYIDIEYERGAEIIARMKIVCENTGCKLIISYHDFDCTPSQAELSMIIADCHRNGADIAKIACMVNVATDNATMLSLYCLHNNLVAFGMGELGKISRLASLGCGAKFTYVAPDNGNGTAPGQLTASQMRKCMETL